MSIAQLIQEIDIGEIVLPAIQRDFVWKEEQITVLLDSLFRGYPVGIALLWETFEPIQFRHFVRDHAPDQIHRFDDNRRGKRVRMVLDGQQRLNSLYVALKGTFNGKKLFYDVLSGRHSDDYSEQKYRFRFADPLQIGQSNRGAETSVATGAERESEPECWLSLAEVIALNPLETARTRTEIATKLQLSEEDTLRLEVNLHTAKHSLSENAELLKTQTIDANLPTDSTQRKTVFDILEIFVRINRQGVPLKRSDLIVSMLRLYWHEASDLLPKFVNELNEGGNLLFDNDFVIRCMFSTAGLGTRLDFELLRLRQNIEKIKATYERCFDAIRSTRDFVRIECGIDNARLLGGISTLVPFVHFLFHAPNRTFPLKSKSNAKRAAYLFGFSKLFSQHVESRTAGFIRDVFDENAIAAGAGFPLAESIQYVQWKTSFDSPQMELFSNNKDLALSLIQNRAGGKIAFAANLPEIDHIFPKSTLAEKNVDWQKIENLANFWILPRDVNRNKTNRHPRDYLASVEDAILVDALIDRALLDFRKFNRFLSERGIKMIAELQRLTKLQPELFLVDAEPMGVE